MPSDRAQIQEIKEKLDIVQVAEKYLTNIKHSGPNYFALCPFHNEKTPSFSINQDLQIFKCFGCGESGDVITFIEKIEGLDFVRALEKAAEMAGVTLETRQASPAEIKKRKEKERLLEANSLAMKYYNYILLEHDLGRQAREYCKIRKINKQIIEKFQIGFAPEGYEHLKSFLLKKGYKQDELVKWGLLVSKNGKIYDKFRKRLMFPIIDHQGDVVGFSGRQIEKSDYGPKYLNSPETSVYRKKETLYGLFQAKNEIRRKGFVVLVEGNVDILSSHRVGIENIVCPLGTALTNEQCKLIRRYAPKVYFALDTDEAGEKALIRGLKLAADNDLEVKALDIGDYQDSDALIMNDPDKWEDVVNNSLEVIELLIKRFSNKYDIGTPKGKSDFVKEIAPYIQNISEDVERHEYIKKVAVIAETDEGVVSRTVNKRGRIEAKPKKLEQKTVPKKAKPELLNNKKNYLAALLLQHKNLLDESYNLGNIYSEWFVVLIRDYWSGRDISKLIEDLEEPKAELISDLLLFNIGSIQKDLLQEEALKIYKALEVEKVRSDINQLKQQIKKAELTDQDSSEMIKELQEKTNILRELSLNK